MDPEPAFILSVFAIIWIGWPLHQIAGHLEALRKKAGAE
jgi:hypothetical protein